MTRAADSIRYAVVDGHLTAAETMKGINPKDRPIGTCECCQERIDWKAGQEVTPHVAHRPGSKCAMTNPETAAHYNGKNNIAVRLKSMSSLAIEHVCNCGRIMVRTWTLGWSDVAVERRTQTRIPDVLLLDERVDPIAAIEVKHSHSVDADKANDLAQFGIPWIEVESLTALAWTGDRPLRISAADERTLSDSSAQCYKCNEDRRLKEALARIPPDSLEGWYDHHRYHWNIKDYVDGIRALRSDRRPDVQPLKEALENAFQMPYEKAVVAAMKLPRDRADKLRVLWKTNSDTALPKLRIALGASVFGSRGIGVITYAKVDHGSTIHHEWINCEVTWATAIRKALIAALKRLSSLAPHAKATFLSSTFSLHHRMNMPVSLWRLNIMDDDSLEEFYGSHAISLGNHILYRPRDQSGIEAINRVQDAASRIREAGRNAPLQSAAG